MKKRRESDINFKLIYNIRTRTNKAFLSQNIKKTNKKIDLLGCSPEFFRRWIIHQLYRDMTIENYSSTWQIDHCLSIASCDLSDENKYEEMFQLGSSMPNTFYWIQFKGI